MDFINRWFAKLLVSGAIRLPFTGMRPCLLYADDALFFLKPKMRQAQILKIALVAFQNISGLVVNLHKSELLVMMDTQLGEELATAMGCRLGQFPFTYLGLPLSNKALSKSEYLPLIQKFSKRLEGWAASHLSIAGRLVLLRAVLSALPTYYMTCFKIPAGVIKDIDKIRRHFLWHGTRQEGKMSLINWEALCTPKQLGGMGVTDLRTFNDAMLAKWYWQWVNPETRLWKTIFAETNLILWPVPKAHFFSITLKGTYSFMNMSMLRIPGRGNTILLWWHDWGGGILMNQFQTLFTFAMEQHISLADALHTTRTKTLFRQNLSEDAEAELAQLQQVLIRRGT